MNIKRFFAMAILTSATGPALTGCASTAPGYVTYLGPTSQSVSVASLAAGDTLGRAIYINDVILAAKQGDNAATPSLATVDDESDQ